MKKLILFLLIGLINPAFSQEIRILEGTTDITGGTVVRNIEANQDPYENVFRVYNSSNHQKTIKVMRISQTKMGAEYYAFCGFGYAIYIPSNDSLWPGSFSNTVVDAKNYVPDNGLSTYLITGPVCQDHFLTYKLYDADIPGDTSTITIHYTCATSIHEFEAGIVSDAYPNPAVMNVTIDYALTICPKNAAIILSDMLGRVVKEVAIENKEGKAVISMDDLQAGLYFYSVVADGKSSKAGKLVIDHP